LHRSARAVVAGAMTGSLLMIAGAASAQSSEAPKAIEIGVTADTIHVATITDVDNPFSPGLFEGAKFGAEGAAKYLNSKAGGGGIGGRKLVIDFIDSQLNANMSRNAVITACQNDFAMVGTEVLFLTSTQDITGCTDKAGATTGLPDLAAFTAGITESCSPTTYGFVPPQVHCDTVQSSPQTYTSSKQAGPYLVKKFGKNDLHGAMLYPIDTKDAENGGRALIDAFLAAGIKADQYKGISATTPQSGYTGLVQQMKADDSNIVNIVGGQPASLASEMQLQGVPSSAICVCGSYNEQTRTNPVMNGVYVTPPSLPFEEASTNAMLRTFLKYVPKAKRDSNSLYGWASTLAFAEAAKATIARAGVNGLTRANFLEHGVTTLTEFDAGGMVGTVDIANHKPSACTIVLQLQNQQWVRRFPSKKGTFDCKASNLATFKADYR
jgi:hypothetical protein